MTWEESKRVRIVDAAPTIKDKLRAEIHAAGERCKRARAKGWIDEHSPSLDSTRSVTADEVDES